jgi:predicted O-linked N-acetylglucosamine transferase (SPINDLY family)
MYFLLQLLLAVIGIYSVLNFTEDMRLYVPLGCLVSMFIVGRLDKKRFENREARKSFLKSEMERILKKGTSAIEEQDSFTINSLLSPKGELVLADAVHYIFKDLGFSVAAGGKYNSVDRIVRIPNTQFSFGLEILMSEEEVDKNHPKINRALQFKKEKRGNEKTLIIASTHVHQPISERERLNEISTELREFLAGCQMSLITTYSLYQLWQKAKGGEVDIFEVFRRAYSHPGGMFSSGEIHPSPSVSVAA